MVVVAAGGSGSFAPGTYALGNKGNGINVDGASATITGNFISANAGDGVAFTGASASSVKGNLIGTNATGTSITGPGDAFDSGGHPTMGPVSLGNGGNGVRVTSGAGVTIGGTDHASGNLISGNNGSGVYLASSNNTVIGNRIGTDATGAAPAGFSGGTRLGNEASGVDVESGSNNQIGGTSPGEGNTIAYNNVNGVTLLNGADPNPVRGNSIFSSGLDLINAQNQLQHFGLGIDIGDNIAGNIGGYGLVTPNSVSLVDGFQPFPEWLQGTFDSSQLTLTGFLPGADGSTTAFIDFYSNAQPNGTGYGEGQTYLGAPSAFQWEQLSAPAGETGQWFVATFQASEVSSAQPYFTATATSADGRTSEFSAYATAAGLPTAVPLPSSSMAILASLGGLGAISFMRRRRHASVR
jgi:parallel beta-helix repeat protein